MKRFTIAALAVLVALASASPEPASARMGAFVFINNSKLCAYVTIYHSSDGATWHAAEGTLGPRYVKAGANFAGSVDWSYVKARAEVTRNTYCTGGRIVDVDAAYHDTSTVPHVQRTATLQSDTRFYITIR